MAALTVGSIVLVEGVRQITAQLDRRNAVVLFVGYPAFILVTLL